MIIEAATALLAILAAVVGFLAWRFRTDVKPRGAYGNVMVKTSTSLPGSSGGGGYSETPDEDHIRALARQGVLLSEVYRRFPHIDPEYVAEIYSSREPR